MKVLEFAFDPDGKSNYLPHNFESTNNICYTGTHDNDTVLGWVRHASRKELKFCRDYLNVKRNKDIPWGNDTFSMGKRFGHCHCSNAGFS